MQSQYNLRRKDTTKGPPLRILSLDGGGVRGYSMLIIIQELMHRTFVETYGKAPRRDQLPKPADHFDLIIGAGTGGLIAIMLGRLRLDLETCKEVYVKTARKVFETDKRIAGIPYTSTIFKASKLEKAIKECVMEHTISQSEGNDGPVPPGIGKFLTGPLNPSVRGHRYHSRNSSVSSFSSRGPCASLNSSFLGTMNLGDPDALMYDKREDRTKTAVTAIYKGTPKGGQPALLRSYDSRKEPPPEFDCTIWQAGRATSAMSLAFKPIQIGQSVFLDEGAGLFNPAPIALEEACVNEWPSREVGVFVSIGTGKRPPGSEQDAHLWYEGFLGEFVDAKKRIIAKIEACETTHENMIREALANYGVNPENYFRFNVEIGVGDFEMNEWNRLADISTSTRRHLAKPDVQRVSLRAASKLARINKAKQRYEMERFNALNNKLPAIPNNIPDAIPEAHPNAVELPANNNANPPKTRLRASSSTFNDFDINDIPEALRTARPRRSEESYSNVSSLSPRQKPDKEERCFSSKEDLISNGNDQITFINNDDLLKSIPLSISRVDPPAPPPKLVLHKPYDLDRALPPYPLDEVPPPLVDTLRKPDYKVN